jgi:hypothetical protein
MFLLQRSSERATAINERFDEHGVRDPKEITTSKLL